ncbi:hypothetical protein [Actinomycetospora termitidis]|uniref:Uncharacterized protein n=1 Tax=Actinomycetospora termitidis TaxID=3053470 RepID=A0ABT7M7V6_9PSEU|nr:hypothetical protein [Actinomycetospora sp. Odt1-22]MDL5155518.1 hypothetical protein [Actinomycetospora sp. Odt1-22]
MAESGFDPKAWRTPEQPYTVHADADRPEAAGEAPAAPARRGPSLIALLVGLVSVAVAALAMAAPAVLVAVDPRWVLAAAAVVIGGGALLAGARRVGGRRVRG